MSVVFDAGSGALRLGRREVELLSALAGGANPADRDFDGLREAGVITPRGVHSAVREALTALDDPVCVVDLQIVTDAAAGLSGRIWIAERIVMAVLPTRQTLDDDLLSVAVTGPDFVPSLLATCVQLGPREIPDIEPVLVPPELLDDLFGDDLAARDAAARRVQDSTRHGPTRLYAAALGAGPWRYWTATTSWPSSAVTPGGAHAEPASRTVAVVDAPAGQALLRSTGYRIAIEPTSTTDIWYALTLLLPSDDDLAGLD